MFFLNLNKIRYILLTDLLLWLLILGDMIIVKMHSFYESKLITVNTEVEIIEFSQNK